jgi:Sigma-70, region 4/Sigma-70 region 2
VAETFLTAFRKRHRYRRGYASARPWLYGIATHLVAQHHRDLARQHRLHQAAGPAPDAPDFAERAAARVTATAIRPVLDEALACLPARDRDVLLLIAWEELSYEEVAAALVFTWAPASPPATIARLTAEQVLDRAAAAALKQPTVIPRPDQFVYHKEYDSGQIHQTWISVDGTRNGLTVTDGLR